MIVIRLGNIFNLFIHLPLNHSTNQSIHQSIQSIREHHQRYSRLLGRYLEVKYHTTNEAEQCYRQLMDNIIEMKILNIDVQNAFQMIGGSGGHHHPKSTN